MLVECGTLVGLEQWTLLNAPAALSLLSSLPGGMHI